MAPSRAPSAGLLRSLRALTINSQPCTTSRPGRSFSTSPVEHEEVQVENASSAQPYYANPDPATVFSPKLERQLIRKGTPPIGSRRRRMALSQNMEGSLPFEQLPYQCFQEARKVLIEDRADKLKRIELGRVRIARLREVGPEASGGKYRHERRIKSMLLTLEKLKILADSNDPLVKKRFEDGLGDMNKPIYRHLAKRKWEEYRKKIQVQRITQMKVAPDVLPKIEQEVDISLAFGKKIVQPGEFVDSKISEQPFRLNVQGFDKGDKLVTIAVVDPDVPNIETDSFENRCHYLASNILISHSSTSIDLAKLSPGSQILLPWLPAFAQKGSPYHRLCIVVLQQKDDTPVDLAVAMQAKSFGRDNFSLRGFVSRHLLSPLGATLFRTKWDEGTAEVMTRAGIEGANVELKRIKVEPLPYKRRNPSTFR